MNGNKNNVTKSYANISLLIAVVASAILLVYLLSLGIRLEQASKNDSFERQTAYKYSNYAAAIKTCEAAKANSKYDCLYSAEEEYREIERSERDLVAQETTAGWTFIMSAAALLGVLLSGGGVVLVWTTFGETRRTNEITREIGEAQVRAYLSVVDATLVSDASREVVVVMKLRNSGNSPALDVRIDSVMKLFRFRGPYAGTFSGEIHSGAPWDDIPSGEEQPRDQKIYYEFDVPQKVGVTFLGSEHAGSLRVTAKISYRTVFDKTPRDFTLFYACNLPSMPPPEGKITLKLDHLPRLDQS